MDQTTEEDLSHESLADGFRYRTSSERNNQDSVHFRDINTQPTQSIDDGSTVDTDDLVREVLVREDLIHEIVDEYHRECSKE